MGLTELELNTLSLAKDFGKAFGILAGIASVHVSPAVLLIIGAIEGLIGYGVQWLIVSQRIEPLKCWQDMTNTAILVTCITNFPNHRGPVTGILKGYLRLSTPIVTVFCLALFNKEPAGYLLMFTVASFSVCLFRPMKSNAAEEKSHTRYFAIFYVVATVIALLLLIFDVTGEHGNTQSQVFCIILLILLTFLLSVPVHIAIQNLIISNKKTLDPEAFTTVVKEDEKGASTVAEKTPPVIREEHRATDVLMTMDFWILFMSFFFGVAAALVVQTNMIQMGLEIGYADVSKLISLTNMWGILGRGGSGLISEYFMKKVGTPRLVWNAASQILIAVSYVLMAIAMPGSLYIGSIIVGICYGVRLTITITSASEMFGLKHYGLIYNIIILNVPLGSILFSDLLAGFLYDAEATATAGGGNICIGAHCHRLVFIVMAIMCVVGFVLDVWLAIRTKALYSKIYTNQKAKKSVAVSNSR
ncbi:hypothetical protein L1987_58318 [Smallanthus sonchifolius]|uniref:Uncharacterized protein n=1 Tax=Smallanthus sonchifolius TaxID=185202 RepID=A0ACB9DFK0_9ASTR|nr:hypothetical protein L1987_58318 [Smallanthus sonchifolius]